MKRIAHIPNYAARGLVRAAGTVLSLGTGWAAAGLVAAPAAVAIIAHTGTFGGPPWG